MKTLDVKDGAGIAEALAQTAATVIPRNKETVQAFREHLGSISIATEVLEASEDPDMQEIGRALNAAGKALDLVVATQLATMRHLMLLMGGVSNLLTQRSKEIVQVQGDPGSLRRIIGRN